MSLIATVILYLIVSFKKYFEGACLTFGSFWLQELMFEALFKMPSNIPIYKLFWSIFLHSLFWPLALPFNMILTFYIGSRHRKMEYIYTGIVQLVVFVYILYYKM